MTDAERIIGDLMNQHNRLTLDVIRGEHSPIARVLLDNNAKWRKRVYDLFINGNSHELHDPFSI
ncbi:hypothetical protein AAULR_24196 [Lacticaseibacillus rhamnosus MTCC 5462]|nr:hypothetical protein AAULR_24196 [Lacticaseibacillus rhamnosus MTCC 5462]